MFQAGEMFSWPGETFRVGDINRLVGGGTTAVGEFASFPLTILLADAGPGDFSFVEDAFEFNISPVRSHFAIRGSVTADYVTAYSGRMWVAETGQILRLEVNVINPPLETGLAQVRIEIEYKDLIPRHAKTSITWPDGTVAVNDTDYPNCRRFGAESKLISDLQEEPQGTLHNEPLRLTPGTEVSVALVTPIDSNTDLTGQKLDGRLLHPLRDSVGKVVADRDTRIRGRIMRLERHYCPNSNFILGITFDEIVINGRSVAVKLEPPPYQVPEGRSSRSGYIRSSDPEMALVPEESRHDVQSFIFYNRDRLRLGGNFVSKWKVSER